ncbi:MAG: hypothetical protein ISS57_09080 [Anaerolineales bacterium]|nr:hypothetical protein [Anaerolineales bacterium]
MAKERTRQELLKEIDELRARLEVAEYRKYQALASDDLTEEKSSHAEERLEAQRTLTTVLESIDAYVYVADMESYEILYMNENIEYVC